MALPKQLKSARMSGSTLGKDIPANIGALETAICDILGFTIDVNVTESPEGADNAGRITKALLRQKAAAPVGWRFLDSTGGKEFRLVNDGTYVSIDRNDGTEASPSWVNLWKMAISTGVVTYSAIPVGPASNPTTDNQLSRKAYVDTKQGALGYTPENLANKGVASGYASLGADGLVPSSQLPASTPELYKVGDIYLTATVYADGAAVAAALGYGTWESQRTDLDFSILMLRMDGDGASFVDSSVLQQTITATGNVTQNNGVLKFNRNTAVFDGTGDYLTVPQSDKFILNPIKTIEFFVRFTSIPANHTFIGGSASDWVLAFHSAGYLILYMSNVYERAWNPSTNTWYHVAVVINGNTCRMFIDGSKIGTDIDITGITFTAANPLKIGDGTAMGYSDFNGRMAQLQIKSEVKYWANFTPPTVPYGPFYRWQRTV